MPESILVNEKNNSKKNNEIANAIREVFSYIVRFKKQIFVLKIDDTLLDQPQFPVLIRDIALLHSIGIKIMIVAGTRRSIDKQLTAYNLESKFYNGIRLTSDEALPLVEQASLGVAQRILSHLTANGCRGIHGNWVQARSLGIVRGIDYMRTGCIEKIECEIIEKLVKEDFIPILPPIGWNKLGLAYNISSTELATELCRYLQIGKLFFLSEEKVLAAALDINQAQEILRGKKRLDFAQKDYLENAIKACKAGAKRVHLLSGLTQGSLLQEVFSSRGNGTMVYANDYWSLRPAHIEDIPDMLRIMQDYVEKGFLLARRQEDIVEKLNDYVVYVVDNTIHGCGALHAFENNSFEIAAIAVGVNYKDTGVGEAVVSHLIAKSKNLGGKQLFLLTTQASDWFYTLGFKDGTVNDLPRSKRDKYNPKRNSRVMVMEI